MSVEQAQQLLHTSEDHRLHALVVVGLMLGLRPAELRGLTWDDIDFEAGTLRVSGVEQGGRRVDEVKVNHERAKRNLVMPEAVATALVAHRHQWELERAVAATWGSDQFVFTTTVGTALDRNNVVRTLRSLCRRAGIGEDWTTYELRHTAASLLYDAGVAKERIADILGHADTRMLDLVYRHPSRGGAHPRSRADGRVVRSHGLIGVAETAGDEGRDTFERDAPAASDGDGRHFAGVDQAVDRGPPHPEMLRRLLGREAARGVRGGQLARVAGPWLHN